jgi:hypothetical protein
MAYVQAANGGGVQALAFGSNVVAGNLIVVYVLDPADAGTITMSADSQGNSSYTAFGAVVSAGAGAAMTARAFYTTALSSAALTVNCVTSTEVADIVVVEFSSDTTFHGYAAAASAGAGSANPSSGTVTVSTSGQSFGMLWNDTGNINFNTPINTEPAAGSFTNYARHDFGYASTANASSFAANATASSRNWIAMGMHFVAGGGGLVTKTTRSHPHGIALGTHRRIGGMG